MNNSEKVYDWCIIGGGITGLVCAELLSREKKSVILVEQNQKLVGETSAEFHEWFHLGSLYSIKQDNNSTIKTLLNSFKKVNEFYSEFKNFNIEFKNSGFEVKEFNNEKEKKWFNNDKLEIRYSLNESKNFKWLKRVARSIMIINKIKNVCWKNNNDTKIFKNNFYSIFKSIIIFIKLFLNKSKYHSIISEDFSFNSRVMIHDLLSNAISNNLKLSLKNKFLQMNYSKNKDSFYEIVCSKENISAKKVIFCNGKNISDVFKSKINTHYAPMLVYKNYKKNSSYFEISNDETKANNCIVKEDNISVVGGASYPDLNEAKKELVKLDNFFKSNNPEVIKKSEYIGCKNEFVAYDAKRNYQYYIWKKKNQDIWAIIPGKFTLAFSAAIDFYKMNLGNDPVKKNYCKNDDIDLSEYISKIKWKEN